MPASTTNNLAFHNTDVLHKIGWPILAWCRRRQKLLLLRNLLHAGSGPPNLRDKVSPSSTRTQYCLRSPPPLAAPEGHTVRCRMFFLQCTVMLVNSLPCSAVCCSSKIHLHTVQTFIFLKTSFLSDFYN